MESSEKDLVLSVCEKLKRFDFNDLAGKLSSGKDLQTIVVGDFKLAEFTSLLNRAVEQLIAEMSKGNWRFLPSNGGNPPNSLTAQLQTLYNHATSSSALAYMLPIVLWLIQYEVQNGFWDRSKLKLRTTDEIDIHKAKADLGLLSAELKNRVTEVDTLKKQLNAATERINSLHTTKLTEFRTLTENLTQANRSLQAVRDNEVAVATISGKLSATLEQLTEKAGVTQKYVDQERLRVADLVTNTDSLQQENNQLIERLEGFEGTFQKVLDGAKEKESEILNQREAITELRGFAADAALGGVFGRREVQLRRSVLIWGAASALAVICAAAWVIFIFNHFGGFQLVVKAEQVSYSASWLMLVVNMLRTSPAFVLVYFCLAQYSKERNLQEEYAFKAAVSMTITAYAAMIDGEEKTKMLVSTVQGVYVPPTFGNQTKSFSLSSKHLSESGKNALEVVNGVKDIVADVAKAAKA